LPAPGTDSGVASTLKVWVDGLRWTEAPTFYGQAPDAQVYVVRQTDGGGSVVRFGDGVRGSRLPTGVDNVIASYRFGAGMKAPPAGSIEQLARPTPGIKSVNNPVAAGGGADRAGEEEIRDLAPKSALLLGRAVSILDMEAAARAAPGVVDAAAAWRWDAVRQRPVVKIWFIGAASLAPEVSARLRALSDPGTPIDVAVAQPRYATLSIDVESDPRAVAADVALAVRAALLDARDGLLPAARIGIGRPLFRSRIFAAVLEVPHTAGVRGLLWNRSPFISYGKNPGAGWFFDLEPNLHVTATAATGP
jgi:predicted phage baseplate assembly protein